MADAPNPKYNDQNIYNKHQVDCDCEDKTACGCGPTCPVGTIAVTDECGNVISCLTPNDAEHYKTACITCPPGYQKTLHPITGEFIGCLTPEEARESLAQLSPDIDPVATPPAQEQFNIVTDPPAINNSELTAFSETIPVEIDRIELSDPLIVQLGTANPPPAGVTIVGGPALVMAGDASTIDVEISVPDTISAGSYPFDLELIGGGITKVLTITLQLT